MGSYSKENIQYHLYELDRNKKKVIYKGLVYIWHACDSLKTRFKIDPDDIAYRGSTNRVSPLEDTVAFDRVYTKNENLEAAKKLFIDSYTEKRTELMDEVQDLDVIIGCLKKERE